MSKKFNTGVTVKWTATGDTGTITGESIEKPSGTIWQVDFGGNLSYKPERQLEEIKTGYSMFNCFANKQFLGYQQFRKYLTHKRIAGGLTNIVYSMKYGDLQFLPYQFKPVFKFISASDGEDGRLLIADEVGLGKTIEALYIWTELQARSNSRRLLIICPSVLRTKWKSDMENHFGMKHVEIVKAKDLFSYVERAKNNNTESFTLITSIEGIRYKSKYNEEIIIEETSTESAKLNKLFEDCASSNNAHKIFDLVVFDEAQKITNSETANYQTVSRINEISHNLLLLSATPVNNSERDLFSLLKLLSSEEFDNYDLFQKQFEENRVVAKLAHLFYFRPVNNDKTKEKAIEYINTLKKGVFVGQFKYFDYLLSNLDSVLADDKKRRETYDEITDLFFYSDYVTRSRKKDVMKTATRTAETGNFSLNKTEYEVYLTVSELLFTRSRLTDNRIQILAIMTRQREMASCMPAALRKWQKKGFQTDFDEDWLDEFGNLLIDDDLSELNTNENDFSIEELCNQLSNYLTDDFIEEIEQNDSKFSKFIEVVNNQIDKAHSEGISDKIVVFSFFRNTLNYLHKRLTEKGIKSALIMGGMDAQEKDRILLEFKENPEIKILLSSEVGSEGIDLQFSCTEINYDLPWNPMRLEQRIGRIDRIGQLSNKIVILNMTCSNTVEDRVLERLYEKINIFTESIGELDQILGDITQTLEYKLLDYKLTDAEIEQITQEEINRFYQKLKQDRQLEEEAGLSRAFNDSIIEYVNNAERTNRYIRKEDLTNYILDFFDQNAHGSSFYQINNSDVWALTLSAYDKNNYTSFCSNNGYPYQLASGINKCTFPQGKIVKNLVSIDVSHPLIKWIVNQSEANKLQNKDCCFNFTLKRECLSQELRNCDSFVFLIAYFESDGLKRKKELIYYACNPETKELFDSDQSEFIISQSLFNGSDVNNFRIAISKYDYKDIISALDSCKEEWKKTIIEMSDTLEIKNNDEYQRQKAKIDTFFSKKIEKQKIQYESIKIRAINEYSTDEERKRYERVLNPTLGKLKKLERDYKEALISLESRKELNIFPEEVAVGLIFVN